jgi:isopentenyl phosphate kinase
MQNLVFLKLGGSLITDKTRPHTARRDTLERLAAEIAAARRETPHLPLLIGHGSGSFGHVAAKKYATRDGITSAAAQDSYWLGFSEVWQEAAALNRLVMDVLRKAEISAMAFPPSATVLAKDGNIAVWDLRPLRKALAHGIVPVVYGDAVFDEVRGGTILSTEELFARLSAELSPQRILLAGLEEGIYADFPARKRRVARVSPESYKRIAAQIGHSAATDVTGGMDAKVRSMLRLVEKNAAVEILIFSGEKKGAVQRALRGERLGTLIAEN